MKVLIYGQTGQVASELKLLAPTAIFLNRHQANLAHPEFCADKIISIKPDAVINAAAFTAVDLCETQEDEAFKVNALAPEAMAQACKKLDIPFIHISTDYVFDGSGNESWETNDQCAPINAYGRTKQAGELKISEVGGIFSILRTSWVFSVHGNNFVKTMLRLGRERDSLNIVSDQIGCPTPARAIAEACLKILSDLKLKPNLSGIYHFSGNPAVSWADFARAIFQQASIECKITDISSSAYPTPAKRPLNSRLNCRSTLSTFGLKQPNWSDFLQDLICQLEKNQ